ncbi:MAG: hypothetical protein A2289_17015 [Deltaproteobacteria bacterium RIFOXYA12_FULL_58_15]|nr:MAG: hypothetical protein A2289_17015 [Deltaproteobacteria bacterium RIFOXYA12_FULL_58_15]OGR15254.1 MAG: hypothetical protein A2341_23185 [Deltaproteobacteria bacterium RIFOXYB12_FULL_58_9]
MHLVLVALAVTAATDGTVPSTDVDTWAVIIANNESNDSSLADLEFADDDGVRYAELFAALGAEVRLLSVLDPQTQRRFPKATQITHPPRRNVVFAELDEVFAEIAAAEKRGMSTQFYFVYAGHGELGPNREGRLTLLDGGLSRTELYHRIIARSPASWNHLIIDACHAYWVVNKRGAGRQGDHREAVESFFAAEHLDSYPNTGVILAASSESKTHEWNHWQSGIFSHELLSAMSGTADIDRDGAVSYLEAATSVQAANAAIADASVQLRVYARPPPASIEATLLPYGKLLARATLLFEPGAGGRVSVRDARGVAIADVNRDGEAFFELALIGEPPFEVSRGDRVATLDAGQNRMHDLVFTAAATTARSGLDASYRQHLYATAFGPSFYEGALAFAGPWSDRWSGWLGWAPAPEQIETRIETGDWRPWAGWAAVVAATGSGIVALVSTVEANRLHRDYEATTDPQEARELRRTVESLDLRANVLYGVAGGLALAGGALLLWSWLDEPAAVTVMPQADGVAMGLRFEF